MVNFYKTINEAFDKRYDSNTKKPLTEASAAHAHPDMSKKAGSISSMILSNKDRIDNATSLQDLRAVVEDILSPLEGNAKVTEINGRLRAMKDHVKALQYIYNIILKGDNLGTIKTGKAKERSKNESVRSRRVNESSKRFDWDNLDVFEQTKIMKDFVRKYNGTKVFEDFADYVGVPVDDVIDLFTDAESRGFIQIPQEKQINSAYASTDIYESVRQKRSKSLKEANIDWYSMDWDDQVNAIKQFVKNYRGTKVFEDFAASVGVDVDDVIDIFADLESYGVIYIPRKIQIDDKYMNNDIYESKSKLKEAASGTFNPDREYDWYEDGDVHPFLDIFNNALDELGLWSEPSIQGGNGYDFFYTKDGDREAGGVDFGIESDFINNLFQKMKGHSWSEIETAIKHFVGSYASTDIYESCGKKRSKKLTENSNKIFKLDRNYSWSTDGKNHPLYPIVMDILDDMGFFMEVHEGYCVFLKQFTYDEVGAMSFDDFAEAMDALTRASNGKSMAEVYDNVEDFLWSDCISMDYKWHYGESYNFNSKNESFKKKDLKV